jgi:predicted Zn-dependent protease
LKTQLHSEQPDSAPEREAHAYLTALLQQKSGEPEAARQTLVQLLKQHPNRIAYIHALATLEQEQGNHRRADQIYRDGLIQYPGNTLLSLASAGNLLEEKSYEKAAALLEQVLRAEPANSAAYRLLAKLENARGNKAASYLAQAEYYDLIGEPHSALDQLNMAKRLDHLPHYYASRIDARLKRLKDELAVSNTE